MFENQIQSHGLTLEFLLTLAGVTGRRPEGGLDRTLRRQMAAVVFSSVSVAVFFSPRSLRPLAATFSGSRGGEQRRLVLYTKPGCCLCDGLKEKLNAALSLDGHSSIHLQARFLSSLPFSLSLSSF